MEVLFSSKLSLSKPHDCAFIEAPLKFLFVYDTVV